jgi:hypothetical protein
MKFTQDFTQDLETIIDAVYEERFCLIRFGDGESAILRNRERPFVTQREGESWDSRHIPAEVVSEMRRALSSDIRGLHIATVCPACSGQSSAPLRSEVRCPIERQTYAEIFGNANWATLRPWASPIRKRFALVSSAPDAEIQISTKMPHASLAAHENVVDSMLSLKQPIALAAGPSSAVLGLRYWERGGIQTCIDVGSLFDELYWGRTRHYMPEGSPRGRRICTWDGSGVGLDTD